MTDHSIKRITKELIEEIKQALKSVERYGSVEIYVQDEKVTQITVRNIKKTSHSMNGFKKEGLTSKSNMSKHK